MGRPKYTIILPLRNGGEYLKLCVHSILAQTYDNFELAVLENCSTDGSAAWLARLNDPRIKIYPAATPLSIEDNWGRALEIPKSEFMTFIGHDDLLDANYLEVLDGLIGQHPDASLYQTHFRFIDEKGKVLSACSPVPPRETAAELLRSYLTYQCQSYSGHVMRSRDYEAVGGMPKFEKLMGADNALWIKLTGLSWKAAAPQECFSLRVHPNSTSRFASAEWHSLLRAMNQFIDFVQNLQKHDPAVAAIFERDSPAPILQNCRLIYLLALVEYTKKNQRIPPRVMESITATLHRVAPHLLEPHLTDQIRNTRSLRLREFINANPAVRRGYIAYIRLRHGKDHLP